MAELEERFAAMVRVRHAIAVSSGTAALHLHTLRVNRRNEFAAALAERGVGTGFYYPIAVHRQKPFEELGYGKENYPISERLAAEVLSIPVHPGLSDADVATVIAAVNEVASALGPIEAEVPA